MGMKKHSRASNEGNVRGKRDFYRAGYNPRRKYANFVHKCEMHGLHMITTGMQCCFIVDYLVTATFATYHNV